MDVCTCVQGFVSMILFVNSLENLNVLHIYIHTHTCAHTKDFENVYFIGGMRKKMSCSSKRVRHCKIIVFNVIIYSVGQN